MDILAPGDALLWLVDGHSRGVPRLLIVKDQIEAKSITKMLYNAWYRNGGKDDYLNNAANHVLTAHQMCDGEFPPGFNATNFEYGVTDVGEVLAILLRTVDAPNIIAIQDLPKSTDDQKTIPSDALSDGTNRTDEGSFSRSRRNYRLRA